MRVAGKLAGIVAVLVLAGCASSPYGPPHRESVPIEEQSVPAEQPLPEETEPPAPPTPAIEPLRQPSAVDNLLHTARRQYDAGNYEAAIATAERALRMERANPEIYLMIGSGYLALLQNELAGQFARQGLAFAAGGSPVRQQLQALLAQARN